MNLSYQDMLSLAYTGLRAAGINEKSSFETAQFLALAELDGLSSHGLARVAQYAGHAINGRIELAPKLKIRSFKTSAALVDACDGLAFPALRFATDISVNIASKTGVSLVAVTITLGLLDTLQKLQLERAISLYSLVILLQLCLW